ncbi:hypothetical protein SUGI_1203610 [Cryptomeria japonica]|uniref:uncharacterized protein LOC131061305 n=1 Tax=Cryptomeria japonica TaxID=3369 RepID=UPI00241472B3|nr:uncharacterized protein LOC131061305 [Cryptomeria japonica]GLJ56061.1 hypothetical protein SUGI_1203610 [Cryptomeria japonica]
MGAREFNVPPMDLGGGIPVSQPRRSINPPFQPQVRPPVSTNLHFMSFDVGSAPTSFAPPPAYSRNSFGAFEDEPPLLEELGINTRLITKKTLNLLNPIRVNPNLHENADLSGPFLFCIAFGIFQLLAGKLHFGVILGWITVASLYLYVVFNMLAGKNGSLDLYRCLSLVGYCMLPMVIFSALALFVPHQGVVMFVMAAVTVVWCTRACSNLLLVLASHGDEHHKLVAYACGLIYMLFSLLVIF